MEFNFSQDYYDKSLQLGRYRRYNILCIYKILYILYYIFELCRTLGTQLNIVFMYDVCTDLQISIKVFTVK